MIKVLNSCFMLVIVITLVNFVRCKPGNVPSYLKLCKKTDPELNKCVTNLFESLRPKFIEGIPELGLPSLDPLLIPEVVVFKGENGQMKAIGRDIKVHGISNFKLNFLKVDVEKLEIKVNITFPYLKYEGTYDVNAKLVTLAVEGKGPMRGNLTDVNGEAVLKGRFVQRRGEKFVELYSATVDVDVKDYFVQVIKLFADEQLNDAVNVLLNDKKMQSMASAKPIVNKVAATMILEMVNKIAKKVPFEEVFA